MAAVRDPYGRHPSSNPPYPTGDPMDATEFVARQITAQQTQLLKETARLHELTGYLNDAAGRGVDVTGEAANLHQRVAEIVRRAAAIKSAHETAACFAIQDSPSTEPPKDDTPSLDLGDPLWRCLDHGECMTIHAYRCNEVCTGDYVRSGAARHPSPQAYHAWLSERSDKPAYIANCTIR